MVNPTIDKGAHLLAFLKATAPHQVEAHQLLRSGRNGSLARGRSQGTPRVPLALPERQAGRFGWALAGSPEEANG
jgi:hypothetical protein